MAHILVTDDDFAVRSCFKAALDIAGHEVSVATNAEEPIRALQTRKIDVLVTDIRIPGMSGLELAEYARHHYPRVKIIVITGQPTEDIFGITNVGTLLVKPFGMATLRDDIRDVLS